MKERVREKEREIMNQKRGGYHLAKVLPPPPPPHSSTFVTLET